MTRIREELKHKISDETEFRTELITLLERIATALEMQIK